jgi:hypothetical protein
MRGALAQKNKNQRVGPPKNNGLKIKFTMPQPGGPVQPGVKKPGAMNQPGQKRRLISAWEVPWTREEEDILKEAIDRFQQVSGNVPIKTWHLHASILNSSIASRGRNRMGKHLKEYWEGRLQPDTQKAQPPYPERQQLSEPTRDANIAAILKAKQMVPAVVSTPAAQNQKSGGAQKQRETVPTVQPHESHRHMIMHSLQQLGVQAISQLTPSELIRRKAAQAAQQASQVRQGHPGQHAAGGGRGHHGVAGQQRMAHAGQVRQGVPGSAGQKMAAGASHGSHAAAMQGGRPVPGKAGAPGQMAAGASGQMHMQGGRGQVPVASGGRGMPQGAGRGQMTQQQQAMAARAQQHQHAMAASQMQRAGVQHSGHGHPPHHGAADGHGQSPHGTMQAGRGYVQAGMPPGAAMPGQHPAGTMPIQHPGMAAHPSQAMMQAQAQARPRAPKKAPASSPRNPGVPPGGAPPKR